MSAALAATVRVDRSPSPALAVDSEGRITAANDGIARSLAATPRELLATELSAWAADPGALRDFLHNGAETSAEFRPLAADGNERWVEISIGKQSVHGATLLSVFDVTARHIGHDKLEEETRRYRDIIGVGGGTLYEVNADLDQIRMWERDTATGEVQIRERSARFPDDVIDPTFNQEGLAETRQRYTAREPVRNLIYRVPGTEVYRLGNSVPFYDDDGDLPRPPRRQH